MTVTPKDAAAVILLRNPADPEMFWVKRNPKLMFMGGFHAFPGGQLDKADSSIPVFHTVDESSRLMRACAAREFFEETGVLLARGAASVPPDQISTSRVALESGEKSFAQILEAADLQVDGESLVEAGRWVTPAFAPRRFDTWFFLAWLPVGQQASIHAGELESGEWIRPSDALARWQRGEIIMAPPTLHIVRTLAENDSHLDQLPAALVAAPEARRGSVRRIEFRPGIFLFPVKTPTLPPATHTNCYIVGGSEVIVIDPASPYEDERQELDRFIDELLAEGRRVREIFLTHHHSDHIAGAAHLSARLGVPVAAHELTARRVSHAVQVDRLVEDNEVIDLEGVPGWRVRALHTPGHTRGHLCFYEEVSGAILTGDLVVGIGTVVIDPPEGNMRQYLNSIERVLSLPKLSSLFPAHGPAIGSAREKLEEYIAHRLMRENRILDAVNSGASLPHQIVELAYTDVHPSMYGLAERSTVAHLEKLEEDGRIVRSASGHAAVQN